jgi:hypothetical protein
MSKRGERQRKEGNQDAGKETRATMVGGVEE